jgi:hypothetical protein
MVIEEDQENFDMQMRPDLWHFLKFLPVNGEAVEKKNYFEKHFKVGEEQIS